MTKNYSTLIDENTDDNTEAFEEYILQKDTIIIPEGEETLEGIVCSEGVSAKLHNDMELLAEIQDDLFYKDGDTLYFIFSRYYKGIGEVKIFFDTTEYVYNQLTIIKVSAVMIFIWFFISLFGGKLISKYTLKNLKHISARTKDIDVSKKFTPLDIKGGEDDEIQILAQALNNAFSKIETQTHSLKQFITDVSHEFKTPLMVINSDIDLYEKKKEKGVLGIDDDSVFLANMKVKTAKLNTLIETLFLLTRMEENISQLQFRKREIGALTKRLVQEKLENYSEKKVNLDFHISDTPFLSIEESSFNIIIENLISNAIKFSKQSLKIDISVNSDFLEVKDYGIGMTKEESERVWEKFYRLDTNTEGFGVGLFLVQRIVKLYGWRIELESEKGEYTSFKIYFKTHT